MSECSSSQIPPAGPSQSAQYDLPPPPATIERDDYAAADQARRRLNKRGFFSSISLPSLHLRRSNVEIRSPPPSPSTRAELDRFADGSQDGPQLVDLAEDPNLSAELDESYDQDVYRWAILYENQRGATFFSTPYYSPLTLLPLDPPPFTVPAASRSIRRDQPTVSLEDFPLPDGSWKWVSRVWMIDMRGDGQVQYDGFEYSRSFRSKKWGPDPGPLSSRGLVRRRRWLRLMVRPAQVHYDDVQSTLSVPGGGFSTLPDFEHNEEGATRPPSVIPTDSDDFDYAPGVWRGNAKDWVRCHAALRRLDRDGRKLEVWASWLGIPNKLATSRSSSMSTVIGPSVTIDKVTGAGDLEHSSSGDVGSNGTGQVEAENSFAGSWTIIGKAPKEYIAAVVRAHGSDILALFVYPDSRARFLLLLAHSGLLPDLREGMGLEAPGSRVQTLDFWSYIQDLGTGGMSPESEE